MIDTCSVAPLWWEGPEVFSSFQLKHEMIGKNREAPAHDLNEKGIWLATKE